MSGSAPAWHVGDWPALAWAETVLKTLGVGVGVGALLAALDAPADGAGGARLAAVVILAVLSLGLVAAIVDRLADREVVGVVFILAMNVGHWCMTVALARDAGRGIPAGVRGADARRRPGEAGLPGPSGFTVRTVPRARCTD